MHIGDELIHSIVNCSQITSKRKLEIQRELGTHMEDFIAASREAGYRDDEIEKLLLAQFGDPEQIAQDFSQVYRSERRMFLALAYALSTLSLAACLLIAILVIQTGLALGIGTPILEVIASRHTRIQALDILAFVAVYLGLISVEARFETHRFRKAALLLLGIVAIPIASCRVAGLPTAFLFYGLITGLLVRAVRLIVPAKTASAVIVPACFALAGAGFALSRPPVSAPDLMATCASWLALGAAYSVMCTLAPRVDACFLNGLQRT